MAKDLRVINETTGYRLRFNQALKSVENCHAAWVVFGESIRSLTPDEQFAALGEQKRLREPLPYSEQHGLKYEPPTGGQAAHWQSRLLAYEATLFAGLATSPRTAP